ncbi:MAG: radical SAM protein [Deltaproteobacteria bacterium]|nr:radical SAM protein [Deltaproteobacteria bacterium]
MRLIGTPLHLPLYRVQRFFGDGPLLPASYTFSVVTACNARCRTCRSYDRAVGQLGVDEYDRIARSIRQRGFWLTLTGGEPLVRRDLADLVDALVRGIRPRLVTLPTNGSFPDRVKDVVGRLAARWPSVHFVANVSLDEIGPRHDELRGLPGSFDLAIETLRALRTIGARNLTIGINTVVSRFNAARFPEVCDGLLALEPESYVVEIAQDRMELGMAGAGLAPSHAEWSRARAHLRDRLRSRRTTALARLIATLRDDYYRRVEHELGGRKGGRACLAATASAFVAPDGEVLACGVRGESLGRLAEADYDFPTVWHGERARSVRRRIADDRCSCSLANQAYLDLAADPFAVLRLIMRSTGIGITSS